MSGLVLDESDRERSYGDVRRIQSEPAIKKIWENTARV